jgi:hypothetical protein
LKIYEGVYKNEEVEVTFKIKEGRLVGGPAGEELALIPVDKHTFEVDGMAGVACIFDIEADKVAGLMVKGLSRQVELKKVEAK